MRFKLPVFIAVLLAAAPIWAHHGSAGFDQKKPVHLVGKISLLDWNNPHIVIQLDVAGADGKVATWLVNTLPPNAAIRRGFPKTSFAVGRDLRGRLSGPGRIESRQRHEHRARGRAADRYSRLL